MSKVLVIYTGRNNAGPSYAYEMTKGMLENGAEEYAVISNGIINLNKWKALNIKKLCILNTYFDKREFLFTTFKMLFIGKKKVVSYFHNITFDAIYIPMQTYWSYMISRYFTDTPVYFTLHDPVAHSGESLMNKMFFYITKKEILHAKRVIVLSRRFCQFVAELYHKNISDVMFLPHGAFWEYKSVKKRNIITQYDEKFNFLFFGRIEDYKGLDILLKAYKLLEKQYPDKVNLIIAGKGQMDKYRSLIETIDHITVLNYMILDEDIQFLFSGSKVITVLPYKDASQSGVIPTAEMFNSLVIASDQGGLSEQLQDGKLGVLFKANDVLSLKNVWKT